MASLCVNSQRVAADFFDKRSNIYSGRPRYISAKRLFNRELDYGPLPVLRPVRPLPTLGYIFLTDSPP
jgi:hypothetical protein